MELNRYLGFKLDEVKSILENEKVDFEVIEAWDTKRTKLGDDVRVVKFSCDDKIKIYVSYF